MLQPVGYRSYFSVTGGRGIAHYFNDLHIVSPVDDMLYVTGAKRRTAYTTPLVVPLVAGYVG